MGYLSVNKILNPLLATQNDADINIKQGYYCFRRGSCFTLLCVVIMLMMTLKVGLDYR